jgi:2-hydroxycyclohexanecarboxyl-CoA dehydrogenase
VAGEQARRPVAIVSGGGGAIGSEITRRLHSSGWKVLVGYVQRERAETLARELSPDGSSASAVALDLEDAGACRASVERVLAEEGRVDGLVFNGGWSRVARFPETDESDWRRAVAINFLGPMRVIHLCLPGMLEAGRGRIVAVTSEAARAGDSGNAPYAAAKAGLAAFLRTLIREYGRRGIIANSVAPGPIDTPMLRYTYTDEEASRQAVEKMVRSIALRRLGRPDEVAAAVEFLMSEAASFVAGQHLGLGGGVVM